MTRHNIPRLLQKEQHPNDAETVPWELWRRVRQITPLPNKHYFIIDEIYGPMAARYTNSGGWKAMHGIDPENVTHCVGFEYPR